ncbi:hypothetical protein XENORESO_011843 [Xenotaenia resolanae]|uniref:Uncharacterized protein n=1 Tax=Xenotaenia resolanae TaxID=208358 RepID=A0ABV0VRS6_9TELE
MCGRGCRWTLSPCCPRYVCVRSSAEEGRSSGGSQGLREDRPGGWVGSTGEPFAVSGYPACSELAVSLLLKGRSHAKGGLPSPQGVWGGPPHLIRLRPQIRRDDPLNLSILLSGGKETNKDSLSSGERRGKSPAPNPRPPGGRGKCGVQKTACPVSFGGLSPPDRGSTRGRCEAGNGPRRAGVRSSRSRVVWECSPKWVVNSI